MTHYTPELDKMYVEQAAFACRDAGIRYTALRDGVLEDMVALVRGFEEHGAGDSDTARILAKLDGGRSND